MRDLSGIVALVGALFCGIVGWLMLDGDGYLKLLGVLMVIGAFGLLVVSMGALRQSRHEGLARLAAWLFWILMGLIALMTLAERFGRG